MKNYPGKKEQNCENRFEGTGQGIYDILFFFPQLMNAKDVCMTYVGVYIIIYVPIYP